MRVLLVVFAAALAVPSAAQAPDRGVLGLLNGRLATQSGYYTNALPGQPVTRVYVWGGVVRPGVYDVGPDFDLEGVLSLAGVAPRAGETGAASGDPDIVLRLYRAGEDGPSYETTLDALVRDGSPPGLAYGDVLEVEPRWAARIGVWGAVSRPGIYEVGPSFTAREALALAGGPVLAPLPPQQNRTTRVTLYRGPDATPAFEGTLEAFLAGPPSLTDGDVIQVESALESTWTYRDTFTVVGLITSGVIATVQVFRLLE